MEFLLLVIYYIFVCVVSGISGSGEGLRILSVTNNSIVWHNQQWIERIGLFLSGAFALLWSVFNSITIDANTIITFNVINMLISFVVLSATSGILFFTWYDGIINKKLNYSFFRVSFTSKAVTEGFAHWYVKIPLIIILLVLSFLL